MKQIKIFLWIAILHFKSTTKFIKILVHYFILIYANYPLNTVLLIQCNVLKNYKKQEITVGIINILKFLCLVDQQYEYLALRSVFIPEQHYNFS